MSDFPITPQQDYITIQNTTGKGFKQSILKAQAVLSGVFTQPGLPATSVPVNCGTQSNDTFSSSGTTFTASKSGTLNVSLVSDVSYGAAPSPVPNPVYTQSSVFGGVTAANATNMADGVDTTGTGTNFSAAESWIQVDFASTNVTEVRLAGGSVPSWGTTSVYLNGALIQWWNGTSWVTLTTVSGITDTNGIVSFSFAPVATTRIRIVVTNNYIATTHFVVVGQSGVGGGQSTLSCSLSKTNGTNTQLCTQQESSNTGPLRQRSFSLTLPVTVSVGDTFTITVASSVTMTALSVSNIVVSIY